MNSQKLSTNSTSKEDDAMDMALMVDDDMEEDPFEEEMKPAVKQEVTVKEEVTKSEGKPTGN